MASILPILPPPDADDGDSSNDAHEHREDHDDGRHCLDDPGCPVPRSPSVSRTGTAGADAQHGLRHIIHQALPFVHVVREPLPRAPQSFLWQKSLTRWRPGGHEQANEESALLY